MKKTKPVPKVEHVEPVAISMEQKAAILLANLKNLWRRGGDVSTLTSPDCEGIIALAKIACSGDGHLCFSGSDDTTPERMAKVAEDIADKIVCACGFMQHFILLPSKGWIQTTENQSQLSPILQQAMPLWRGFWWTRIKCCMCPLIDDDLETFRDWLDAFMPDHADRFTERLWIPWQNHRKTMIQKWSAPTLEPWPEALQHFRELNKSGLYLRMLQTKIQNADGKGKNSCESIKGPEYQSPSELCAMVGVEHATSNDKLTLEQNILEKLCRAGEKGLRIGEIIDCKNEGKGPEPYRNLLEEWKGRGIVDRSGNRGPWRLTKKCHAKK